MVVVKPTARKCRHTSWPYFTQQKDVLFNGATIRLIVTSADYLENRGKQSRVKEYERQVDQMVYELYGLTPEEIEVVDGSLPQKQ